MYVHAFARARSVSNNTYVCADDRYNTDTRDAMRTRKSRVLHPKCLQAERAHSQIQFIRTTRQTHRVCTQACTPCAHTHTTHAHTRWKRVLERCVRAMYRRADLFTFARVCFCAVHTSSPLCVCVRVWLCLCVCTRTIFCAPRSQPAPRTQDDAMMVRRAYLAGVAVVVVDAVVAVKGCAFYTAMSTT